MRVIYSVEDCIHALKHSIPAHLEDEGQYTKAFRARMSRIYLELMYEFVQLRAYGGNDPEALVLLEKLKDATKIWEKEDE